MEGRQHMCKLSKYKCLLWTEAGVWTARGFFSEHVFYSSRRSLTFSLSLAGLPGFEDSRKTPVFHKTLILAGMHLPFIPLTYKVYREVALPVE